LIIDVVSKIKTGGVKQLIIIILGRCQSNLNQ